MSQSDIKKQINNFLKNAQYKDALSFLQEKAQENPNNQEILYHLGVFYFTAGMQEDDDILRQKATQTYKKLIAVNPETFWADLAQARMAAESGNSHQAADHYYNAYKKEPSAENALHAGNAFSVIKEYKRATQLLKEADTKGEDVAYQLAQTFYKAENFQEAKQWAKTALERMQEMSKESKQSSWFKNRQEDLIGIINQ